MTEFKQLIGGLGLKGNKAYSLETKAVLGEESIDFCCNLNNMGADRIFIFDLSEDGAGHETTIGTLKEITRRVDTPIIAGGWTRRMEDVKKYLYAGADAVFLDVSMEEQVDFMKEAASRFGSEKIYAYLPDSVYLPRTEEYMQLGASKMIVNSAHCSGDELALYPDAPFMVIGSREDVVPLLSRPNIQGVICQKGQDVNYMELKQKLKAEGLSMDTFESSISWDRFHLNPDGLIPVIVQDYKTGEVLMLAYMNEEAFDKTLETGIMTYYSRSRKKLWVKGETSGHFQYVKSLSIDCDEDTILAKVHQIGSACHTGNRSCFYRTLAEKQYKETNPLKVFEEEYAVIRDRKEHPKEGSYTNYLFDKGIDKILKKCGEEATEIIIAAKNPDPEEIKYEIADFLYHVMVLMVEKGVTWHEITKEIANR